MEINLYAESKILDERIFYQINQRAKCYNEIVYWRVLDSTTIQLCTPANKGIFFDDIILRFEKDFPEYCLFNHDLDVIRELVVFSFSIKRHDYGYFSQKDLYNMLKYHNDYHYIDNFYYI